MLLYKCCWWAFTSTSNELVIKPKLHLLVTGGCQHIGNTVQTINIAGGNPSFVLTAEKKGDADRVRRVIRKKIKQINKNKKRTTHLGGGARWVKT